MSSATPLTPRQRKVRLYRRAMITVLLIVSAWMIIATIVGVFGDILSGHFPARDL